ncbi:MAG TPA: tetratricopeptide repeat protein [Anaerolineaceae bacterium]|nr:tetratricopeptide repeat protein [Anaerolineaceae bacterium]HPN51860.1 tetratricopeptide repeat protein [Anaerolineaceae bacterium]
MASVAPCHVCGLPVMEPEGYIFSTVQVVSSPGYWEKYIAIHRYELAQKKISTLDDLLISPARLDIARESAQRPLPWLVCDDCVNCIASDHAAARAQAAAWWQAADKALLPLAGAAQIEQVRMSASQPPLVIPPPPQTQAVGRANKMPPAAPVIQPAPPRPTPVEAVTVPQRKTPPPPPKPPVTRAVSPIGAALLNLSGLGLGYAYLGQWLRFVIYFLLFSGLALAAYFTGGAGVPGIWLLGLTLLAAWEGIDAWLLASKQVTWRQPKHVFPVLAALVVLAVETTGLYLYYDAGQKIYEASLAAYQAADDRAAFSGMERMVHWFSLTLNPNLKDASDKMAETALLISADKAYADKDFARAAQLYEVHASRFGGSARLMGARLSSARVYAAWGDELSAAGKYKEAIDQYKQVTAAYPEAPETADARQKQAVNFLAWGDSLFQAADYEQALKQFTTVYQDYPDLKEAKEGREKAALSILSKGDAKAAQKDHAGAVEAFEQIIADYADTSLLETGQQRAAQTYLDWGEALFEQKEFEAAVEKLDVIEAQYAAQKNTAAAARKTSLAVHSAWAASQFQAGQFEKAAAIYETIFRRFTETEAADLRPLAAESHLRRAQQLRQQGSLDDAIKQYDLVLADFADTPSTVTARVEAAETLFSRGAELRQAGQFSDAVARYEDIVIRFADQPPATLARDEAASAYMEWGSQLKDQKNYAQAVTAYEAVVNQYSDLPSAKQAREAAAATYLEWGNQLSDQKAYIEAVTAYEAIIQNYSDLPQAKEAKAAIPMMYVGAANDLVASGRYEEAIDNLNQVLTGATSADLKNAVADGLANAYMGWGKTFLDQSDFIGAIEKYDAARKAAHSASVKQLAQETYLEAVYALARDTGSQGQQVLSEAQAAACANRRAASPAVGILGESPKAIVCNGSVSLPSSYSPTYPGHFRYAVRMNESNNEIQRCSYTGGHTLVRVQVVWTYSVRDVTTGAVVASRSFTGGMPGDCPDSRYFYSSTDYLSGSGANTSDVYNWLVSVIR